MPLRMHDVLNRSFLALLQARQQLKEMVWIKSSENMVLEAMYRLAGLHEALEDLLRVQPPQDMSSANNKDKAPASPTGAMLPGSHASASGSTGHGSASGRMLAQAAMFEAGPSNPDAAGAHPPGHFSCPCHPCGGPREWPRPVPSTSKLLPSLELASNRGVHCAIHAINALKRAWMHTSAHVEHAYLLGLLLACVI